MEDTGFDRFPVTLDPTAQEFRPTYPLPLPHPHPHPHPHTYYSYSYPYNFYSPPLPPPPAAVYVAPKPPSIPPPLPPPSTTPTRTLLLSSVPSDVSESIVRRDLEVFGDVRAVQMEKARDGIVTVYFYSLRQSMEALQEIQEQHMQQQCRLRKHFDALMLSPNNSVPPYNYRTNSYLSTPLPPPAPGLIAGRAVWAQFTFPVAAGLPDGYNQGTIVVFNLGSDVAAGTLKEIFEAFGCVKELRGTPLKKNQRFVEFYDTRDAAKALINMNGKEIHGKTVVVEFSRPGGHKNSPKHHRLNPITSIRPPSIILSRKFPSDSLSYRHPPPPPPPPQQCCNSRGSKLGGTGKVVDWFRGSLKKTGRKQPEQQGGVCVGGGVWSKQRKGSRQAREKYDPRFLIKEDGIISESSFSDSRTTVMIKNIPNKYSQKLLLNMLDNHCIHCNEQIAGGGSGGDQPLSSYDFVYLPIDFMNKCNVGYGFVNMTSPEATWRLYKAFHHQNWEVFNSKKICEVSYARLQGVEALQEHFKNSRFPCEAEGYMPVVFSPPRDGRRLTEPTPIVGRSLVAWSEGGCYSSHSNSNDGMVVEDVNSDESNDGAASDGAGGDGDQ